MKQILIPASIAVLLLVACGEDNRPRTGYDLAKFNSQRYMRDELGSDTVNYVEGTWGVVEPRRIDYLESNAYKGYHDSLLIMEDRLRLMDDSIAIEYNTNRESKYYIQLRNRRDVYNMELEQFRKEQDARQRYYDDNPDYDGFWMYHEYQLNGQPHRVYILMGDTVKYTPSGLIYK